ncbi:Gfo/Idh/MocA family protein [Novipirellula artificiosorum]|uniref:1,5-anhydro-D-fructose reductase n=1 Tax=Novipirellula artificiosorum TaxID=2528016 RepID=A0A5C6DW55_9BACT|nr:Gfo/Idh/MocA family oxidoreductase [Novipirellula artificiosorum]TWU40474.1 1,5-anhydro-D-fructose reductase [Novipirellula artificiosorum]
MNHTPPTRFGVIGTGRITRRLIADLQSTDGAEVTAIASRTAERARWYADQHGIAAAVEGYASLLDRDDVDAVYIALPPSMHAEWTLAAANAKKHVLCEKPLSISPAESNEMDRACQFNSVRWLDATGWLHHERTEAFSKWFEEQRLGKIGHISASVSFYQPFQTGDHRLDPVLGGGCLLDLGWYSVGLIRLVTGQLPTAVFADQIIRQGVSQRVTAMMWFDDGITATVSCGYDTATRKWFEVAGDQSSLVCDDFTRPWTDRPARCWIHDAAGTVEPFSFAGDQERRMIGKLISDEPLEELQKQALDTQRILAAMEASIEASEKVVLET